MVDNTKLESERKLYFEFNAILVSLCLPLVFLGIFNFSLGILSIGIGDYQKTILISHINTIENFEGYNLSCSNMKLSWLHFGNEADLSINEKVIKIYEGYNYKFNEDTYFIILKDLGSGSGEIEKIREKCSIIVVKSKGPLLCIISKINNFIGNYFLIMCIIGTISLYISYKKGLLKKILPYPK
ncbi:MAG: hypothetical protein WC413_04475 [Candidatus Nanoarchaeia archaeon]